MSRGRDSRSCATRNCCGEPRIAPDQVRGRPRIKSVASFRRIAFREDVMAKGQMRSNKEKKKPKAEHNKKQKGAAAAGGQGKIAFTPGKK